MRRHCPSKGYCDWAWEGKQPHVTFPAARNVLRSAHILPTATWPTVLWDDYFVHSACGAEARLLGCLPGARRLPGLLGMSVMGEISADTWLLPLLAFFTAVSFTFNLPLHRAPKARLWM